MRARLLRSFRTECSSSPQVQKAFTSSQQLKTIRIKFRGLEAEVPLGTKLRTALLKNGLSPHSEGAVYINCRGIGSCGTCAVEIKGDVSPAEWTTAERLRLNFPPHSPPNNQRLRLACQVACMGDLDVTKYDKFWGEGSNRLPDLSGREAASVTPLGSLEFVLDSQAGDRGPQAP